MAAPERSVSGNEATGHSHHHASAAQESSEGDRAPHSHTPGPDHHQDSDGGCAQHCASLQQTLTTSPARVPVPNFSWVMLVPVPTLSDLPRATAGAFASLDVGRPPPDLLTRNTTLRI